MTAFDDTLERFREAVAGPPDEVPLARAALLVAQAEYPGIDIDAYERRLQDMSETLVQQIARAHGGEVTVHPVTPTGTVFRVAIPAETAAG